MGFNLTWGYSTKLKAIGSSSSNGTGDGSSGAAATAARPPAPPAPSPPQFIDLNASLGVIVAYMGNYMRLAPGATLTLLRVAAQAVPCEDMLWLHAYLQIVKIAAGQHANPGDNYRLVYPDLYVKSWQTGPVKGEDIVITCRDAPDYAPSPCPELPNTVVNVSSHDELLAALLTNEQRNVRVCQKQRTILRFTRSVSIDVARWPPQGVFITSNVSFVTEPGSGIYLDFGARVGLFNIRGSAYVRLEYLVLINLPIHPAAPFTVPIWPFFYRRNLDLAYEYPLHLVGTTGVVPTDEFVHLAYWTTIITSPSALVANLAAWQRMIQRMDVSSVSTEELHFSFLCGLGITGTNVTITARLPPGAPPQLTPLTGLMQVLDLRMGPPYLVAIYNTNQLQQVLTMPDQAISHLIEQEGLTTGNTTAVTLLLQSSLSLHRAAWAPAMPPIRRRFIVQGKPFVDVALDLSSGLDFFNAGALAGDAALLFKRLTLRSLAWAAPYNATTAARGLPLYTFLQTGIWAVTYNRASSRPRVEMDNVVLMVAPEELLLLQACWNSYSHGAGGGSGAAAPLGSQGAAGGGSGSSAQGATAPPADGGVLQLPKGLSDYNCRLLLPPDTTVTNSSAGVLQLASVQSSLFLGTTVTYLADPSVSRPDLLDLMAGLYSGSELKTADAPSGDSGDGGSSSSSSSSSSAIIGAAVGAAVGGVLLLAVGGALFVQMRQRKQERQLQVKLADERQHHLEELSRSNPLARLILEHLALAAGAAGGSGAQQQPLGLSASGAPGGSGGDATAHAVGGNSDGVVSEPMSADVAMLRAKRVNVAASDLAEVLLALPILGSAVLASNAAGAGGAGDEGKGKGGGGAGAGVGAHALTRNSSGGTRSGSGGGGSSARGSGGRGAPVQQPLSGFMGFAQAMALRLKRTSSGSRVNAYRAPLPPPIPARMAELDIASPVLEELHRLSIDLAGEIDDNQLIVTEVVASGGFGTVYKGSWHGLPVAVKTVLFSTASINRRIALQEAALSKSISHPNIVATYAVDAKPMAVLGRSMSSVSGGGGSSCTKHKSMAEIQEWRLYIIQEFCDCGTLRRALDKKTFHDPDTGQARMDMLLDILLGVASALAHLHTKNIVHGDLNPKNVLLKAAPHMHNSGGAAAGGGGAAPPARTASANGNTAMGAGALAGGLPGSTHSVANYISGNGSYPLAGRCGFQIKVADFGLSVKMAAHQTHVSNLRQGTPFYAAPEVVKEGIFSRAADAYAYGILMWELYCGKPIWVPDPGVPGGYSQQPGFPGVPAHCPAEYVGLMVDCLQSNHLQRPLFDSVLMRLRAVARDVMSGTGSGPPSNGSSSQQVQHPPAPRAASAPGAVASAAGAAAQAHANALSAVAAAPTPIQRLSRPSPSAMHQQTISNSSHPSPPNSPPEAGRGPDGIGTSTAAAAVAAAAAAAARRRSAPASPPPLHVAGGHSPPVRSDTGPSTGNMSARTAEAGDEGVTSAESLFIEEVSAAALHKLAMSPDSFEGESTVPGDESSLLGNVTLHMLGAGSPAASDSPAYATGRTLGSGAGGEAGAGVLAAAAGAHRNGGVAAAAPAGGSGNDGSGGFLVSQYGEGGEDEEAVMQRLSAAGDPWVFGMAGGGGGTPTPAQQQAYMAVLAARSSAAAISAGLEVIHEEPEAADAPHYLKRASWVRYAAGTPRV